VALSPTVLPVLEYTDPTPPFPETTLPIEEALELEDVEAAFALPAGVLLPFAERTAI
jgi:hypothetical protein